MKRVTQTLADEHRLVQRAAACVQRLADDASLSDELCIETASELLEFFEDFVDLAHQEKEERCLFPVLLDLGLAPHRVHALLEDHTQERRTLATMRGNLEGAAYGDAWCRDGFVRSFQAYAEFQSDHAAEEDELLLPLVEELLAPDDEERVLHGFRRLEETLLEKPRAYYLELVERAAQRLGSGATLTLRTATAGSP